jgi:hypothetical protein
MGNQQTTQTNSTSGASLQDGQRVMANTLLKTTNRKVNYSSTSPKVVRRDVADVTGAFVLDNVLTPEECAQFIEITEEMGYGLAPVSIGDNIGQVMTGKLFILFIITKARCSG